MHVAFIRHHHISAALYFLKEKGGACSYKTCLICVLAHISTYHFYDILVCRYDSNGILSLALHLRKENSLTPDVSGLFKSLTVTTSNSKLHLANISNKK